MGENEYLSQVASLAGLRHYPGQGPFGRKSGSAIGAHDGYVTAIGFERSKNEAKVSILVRFKKLDTPEILKPTLAQNAALSEKKQGKFAAASSDSVRWNWKYSLTKPKAEDVANLANSLREAIKPVAQGFDGKCEKCRSTSTPELTLMNGVPLYICPGCQQQTHMELDQAAMNYEAITPNYPNGIALGIAGALLGGIAWGLVAYGLNRIFLWGAILIGYAIAWGVGRREGHPESHAVCAGDHPHPHRGERDLRRCPLLCADGHEGAKRAVFTKAVCGCLDPSVGD